MIMKRFTDVDDGREYIRVAAGDTFTCPRCGKSWTADEWIAGAELPVTSPRNWMHAECAEADRAEAQTRIQQQIADEEED
jgi:RNA polymerase subunit RPABC4/transcription elongation factor Spt4